MAEDLGEKTEEATPKRKQQARERGQVPKSQDLAGAILLFATTLVIAVALIPSLGTFKKVIEHVLSGSTTDNPVSSAEMMGTVEFVAHGALRVAAPVLLVAWLVAYLAHFWQVGWLFSFKSLEPSLNKLNPINGFKKIFGLSGLVKVGLDSLKVALILIVAVVTIHAHSDEIIMLPRLEPFEALLSAGKLMLDLAIKVLAVLLFLGILDFVYQKWKHKTDLRMSKQQVKDEMKQSDGDPEVKRRRLRMQQQIAMQRISSAVPQADVIVTNPEHISVAIQYDAERMHAPKVVAKGGDYLAMRIRHIGLQHNIPIVERKPLARALFAQVPVGQEVPPEFYQAVAEILAYVYRLDGRMAG